VLPKNYFLVLQRLHFVLVLLGDDQPKNLGVLLLVDSQTRWAWEPLPVPHPRYLALLVIRDYSRLTVLDYQVLTAALDFLSSKFLAFVEWTECWLIFRELRYHWSECLCAKQNSPPTAPLRRIVLGQLVSGCRLEKRYLVAVFLVVLPPELVLVPLALARQLRLL
jgi:hypothetical protein